MLLYPKHYAALWIYFQLLVEREYFDKNYTTLTLRNVEATLICDILYSCFLTNTEFLYVSNFLLVSTTPLQGANTSYNLHNVDAPNVEDGH